MLTIASDNTSFGNFGFRYAQDDQWVSNTLGDALVDSCPKLGRQPHPPLLHLSAPRLAGREGPPGDTQVTRAVFEQDFEQRGGLLQVLVGLGCLGDGTLADGPQLVPGAACRV